MGGGPVYYIECVCVCVCVREVMCFSAYRSGRELLRDYTGREKGSRLRRQQLMLSCVAP